MQKTAATVEPAGNGVCADDPSSLLGVVLENVGEGLWIESAAGPFVNPAGRRLLGLADGDDARVIDIPIFDWRGDPIPHDDHPSVKARLTGMPQSFTHRVRRFDGVDRFFSGSASPLPGGDVVFVFRDITEEHERSLVEQQLLREGFKLLPLASSIVDLETSALIDCNDAFTELTGYTAEDARGLQPPYPWWAEPLDHIPADDVESGRFEFLFRHRDGRLIPVEVLRFQVRGPRGGGAIVAMFTDLSERRAFEQQLVQSGKLAALGELAAGVAHEINNPLFAILGLVEFLLRDAEPGSKSHDRLLLVQQTGHEIKEIVRGLLDFARERSDERVVVPLAELARQTIDLVRRTSANKGVEVVEDYEGDAAVEVAPSQVKQVFLNLVANARHAMQDGGTLTVRVRREGDTVEASFADTGVGMPADVVARIFEPFFTTKRSSGGTGLGLSVSHGIVAAHGGSLDVVSEPGVGTTFTLRLPAAGATA